MVIANHSHSPDQILNSWKQIAGYLKCGIRTAQRWEAEFGLPVHRLAGKRQGSVMAVSSEIDHWLRSHPLRQVAAPNENRRPVMNPGSVSFLLTEIECGLTFASLAFSAQPGQREKIERNLKNAHKAYFTALRFRERLALDADSAGRVENGLQQLRTVLESREGMIVTGQAGASKD